MLRTKTIDRAMTTAAQTNGLVLRGLVVLVLFCGVAGMLRGTIEQCERNRLGAVALQQQQARLAALRQKQQALRQRRDFLLSRGGIVAEARRFNWLRPEERRIWFEPGDEGAAPELD